MEEKMITDFIDHYNQHRQNYAMWKPEDIAKTFVNNWEQANKISSKPMLSDEVCVHPFENVVISGTDICCFKCGKKLK